MLVLTFAEPAGYGVTDERMNAMMSAVGAPGVNTSATPSASSSGMSCAGIVPPTVTSTRDDLRPAIVAVEAGLRHDHAQHQKTGTSV